MMLIMKWQLEDFRKRASADPQKVTFQLPTRNGPKKAFTFSRNMKCKLKHMEIKLGFIKYTCLREP